MKKLLTIILTAIFIGLSAGIEKPTEKVYTFKLTERQTIETFRQLAEVSQYIYNLNIPQLDARALIGRLDTIRTLMFLQLPDSLKSKK